ncbi:DUF4041 domain-containing protein [Enterococcus hirae]|nr:DUF4041 domain-containing protein [Enterococcus hirae]
MSIFDFLQGNKFKKQVEELQYELNTLKETRLSLEQMTIIELDAMIQNKQKEIKSIEEKILSLKESKEKYNEQIIDKKNKLNELNLKLISTEDSIEMESFGIYEPKYNFASSLAYKEQLQSIRRFQKEEIKKKTATYFSENWTVDGSKAKGRKMTNDNIKQILRSFNNECEAAINKVKYSNLSSIEKRIQTSYTQLNKMNESVKIAITPNYLDLKLQELYLAFEYEQKKQEEKELLREQREKEREEKALQKELQSKKKVIDKDINHYKKMIDELNEKLKDSSEQAKMALEKEILELQTNIQEKEEEKQELDYRSAHASAGYVYIISNIGAFGKDVVKIGVTRRLDPLERIAELSSASVPFKFDIHALIFSYEAYQLEADLHNYFDNYRVNKINHRKEFFKVPIDKIENKLEEYKNLTIDFNRKPDAEEYYQSISIEEKIL